jgi:hypothetical protein
MPIKTSLSRGIFYLILAALAAAGLALGSLPTAPEARAGVDRNPQLPQKGKVMHPTAATTVTPTGKPPIDLAAPARTATATFALG